MMMKRIFILWLFITASDAFSQSSPKLESGNKKPFILGVIDELQSKVLGETRTLNIYLPEGYDPNDTVRYPVCYLLDGSADEDFIHVVGAYQFNSFEWIERVPKTIVVGIATVDRRRDFTFPTKMEEDKKAYPTSGHSDKFIAFIEKELQPYINGTYKTNNSRTIIGQSLGGLLVTEILFKKPQLFNSYIIISPSLWWDDGSLLKANPMILKEDYILPTTIYLAVGKEGLAPCTSPHIMEVDANLLAEKLQSSKSKAIRTVLDYLPEEDHATIGHQAVMNGVRGVVKK